jgi:alkylresorcinol/alkylpyrone synthase
MSARPQILSVVTHTPPLPLTRDDTLRLLPMLTGGPEGAARFRGTVERSRIDLRHVETDLEEMRDLSPGERSRIFERRSAEIVADLGGKALAAAGIEGKEVTAVVTVSCTGYMLPSVDAYVLPRLGIPDDVRRVPITELGCSAGVGGIGLATELLAGRGGHALVCSVELCSSCMQTTDMAPSDVIGNILFADGAAAVVLGPSGKASGPEVLATRTVLWPDTTSALGMRLSDTGLRLMLAPDLPEIIGERLPPTLDAFLDANGVRRADVGFWVVHPGGPRVLEEVGARLGLSAPQLEPSWKTWGAYGNVSSATIFYILRAHMPVPAGRLGVMMAFGPGLSCELVLLRAGGWLGDAPR